MTFPLNADLHCHSTTSDGTLTPEQLAARAAANGVDLWALTDHDEVGGQQQALEAARAQSRAAGVPVELEIYRGVVHGFLTMGRSIVEARQLHADAAAALRRAFER